MLENFLTIPAAPKYEINSQFICRNRKTKKVLKLFRQSNGSPYYSLRIDNNKIFKRSPEMLRRLAKAAADPGTFEPIPSLDYRYEINKQGKVRNTVTKKVLTPKLGGKLYCFQIGGKGNYFSRATSDLLWEVHGKIIERRFRPCPCSAEKADGKFFFPHMKACARFLAPKVFFCFSWVYKLLNRREPIIEGWKITYLEDKPEVGNAYLHSLGREAQRLKKLDKELGYEN